MKVQRKARLSDISVLFLECNYNEQPMNINLPFCPQKLLLKPLWFIFSQLEPLVPWKRHFSMVPPLLAFSILCLLIAYVLKSVGFWIRSILTTLLLHDSRKRLLTLLYSWASFEGSNWYIETVSSCPVFGSTCWESQWTGMSSSAKKRNTLCEMQRHCWAIHHYSWDGL